LAPLLMALGGICIQRVVFRRAMAGLAIIATGLGLFFRDQ
jgi:hypothetical protein